MTDPRYAFWRSCLAAKEANKPIPAAVVDQPECGFWRLKRHGSWIPVAVWPRDGSMGFKIGTEVVGEQVGTEQWPRYCANPITEAVYRAIERHEPWPDADPVVEAMLSSGTKELTRKADIAAIQSNIASESRLIQTAPIDSTAEFREQIKAALSGVAAYTKIESDETDVRALSLRNMLNELAAAADKAREAEKAPHLKAEREVDAKWQPMVKAAREGARKIKDARDQWQDDKREAAAEASRRAQEALEQQMLEAAEKGEEAASVTVPPPQSNLPPPSAQVRPAYGKASHTGSKIVITELDAMKFIAALKPRSEWPTVFEFLLELAQKLANRGIVLDGVTTKEKANTR